MRAASLMCCLGVVGGLFLPGSSQVAAQERPSVAECQRLISALESGDRTSARWERLPSCGAAGASALAQELRTAKTETDAVYLHGLYGAMRNVRASNVLEAAAQVSGDKSAAVPARATALLVLLSQFDNRLVPSLRKPWGELVSKPIGDAYPFAPVASDYVSRSPLPADSLTRITTTLDALRKDRGENAVLRDLAQCIRTLISADVPTAVDTKAIILKYLCGNRFEVQNASGEWVTVSFEVANTADRGDLNIAPAGKVSFTAREKGTMLLFYRGIQLQTERNPGRACAT